MGAVQFLLDGLAVESLVELKHLVDLGWQTEEAQSMVGDRPLGDLEDEEIRELDRAVYDEGVERGWGKYWN